MNHRDSGPETFWRGHPSDATGDQKTCDYRERILLLLGAAGNRKLLSRHLARHYQVLKADDLTDTDYGALSGQAPFDLAIVDAAGIQRWRQLLIEARSHSQPVFLPAMLIASQKDLPRALQACGPHIDEFLLAPIEPGELNHRVGMLLRARHQALTQSTRLAYLTHHDQVSGLPNKMLFLDRLSQAIQDATVLDRQVYAIVVHIALAPILKSLGNHALEEAGVACSQRLRGLVREQYSLARLSTEEWGLMLRGGSTTEDAIEVARDIRQLERTPLKIGDERIHVTPSVGVAIYPDDAANAYNLLDCAGAALARAGDSGKSRPAFYSRNVQRQALSDIRTEAGLYEALTRNQFELWLQPKIDLESGAPVGAEALIRWRLSSGELVPPANFIPVAERTGLITQIDRWVLSRACECLSRWPGGEGPGPVSINISAQHLERSDFVTHIQETLARYDLAPQLLELELTETTLADLGPENLVKLRTLRQLGISIALDDFGTGYCSLLYLQRLPITTLKIDKGFVDHIALGGADAAITRTIVDLARNFKLKLVAEGVETQAQADCLCRMQVETGQGYLFAKPLPLPELDRWLAGMRKRLPRTP